MVHACLRHQCSSCRATPDRLAWMWNGNSERSCSCRPDLLRHFHLSLRTSRPAAPLLCLTPVCDAATRARLKAPDASSPTINIPSKRRATLPVATTTPPPPHRVSSRGDARPTQGLDCDDSSLQPQSHRARALTPHLCLRIHHECSRRHRNGDRECCGAAVACTPRRSQTNDRDRRRRKRKASERSHTTDL